MRFSIAAQRLEALTDESTSLAHFEGFCNYNQAIRKAEFPASSSAASLVYFDVTIVLFIAMIPSLSPMVSISETVAFGTKIEKLWPGEEARSTWTTPRA